VRELEKDESEKMFRIERKRERTRERQKEESERRKMG
jgi:hypothetical protein